MDSNPSLTELSRTLADLYPRQEMSVRIVRESGVPEALVRFQASAIDNWHEIVHQTAQHQRLVFLIATVRRDYPEDQRLKTAEQELANRDAFPGGKISADNISAPRDASQVMSLARGLASLGKMPRIVISELPSGRLEWRGVIGADRIGELWVGKSNYEIAYSPSLFRHEDVSEAILRLALHGSGGTLFVHDAHQWMEHTPRLVGQCIGTAWDRKSPNLAGATEEYWGLKEYTQLSGGSESIVHTVEYGAADLAHLIHDQLDHWVLNDLSDRIVSILRHQNTADFAFKLDEELATEMWIVWKEWRDALHASPDLHRHFMRVILTTAIRDQSRIGHARVGRRTVRRCLVHSIVFALAVTVGLPREFRPAEGEHYENLEMLPSGKGHLCGLELIDTIDLSVKIQDLIWRTDCVLLPHYDGPGDEIAGLNKRFRENGGASHRFDKPSVYTPLFFANETALRRALGEGIKALRPYLLSVVHRWDMRQQAEFKEATEGAKNAPQSR